MMLPGLVPLAAGVPLAASVLLAVTSGEVSRRLSPRTAAALLTLLALATSMATGVVLCLAGFSALARQPLLAAAGGWSRATGRPLEPLPASWGLLAGAVAAVLMAGACGYLVRAARELIRAGRACRLLAAGDDKLVITPDERPSAYTVPARTGAIVVSAGMLRLLSADERRALLAHEAAHLRHHHAGYVLLARLAAAANPLLRPLAHQVDLAVERWADEVAAGEVGDRRVVARALARASLAASRPDRGPGLTLAIGQTDISARLRALTGPPPSRRRWAAAAALTLTLASGTAALTLTWAAHQRIEIAQLAYLQARDRGHGRAHPVSAEARTGRAHIWSSLR
jgi:hypothetical protein